METVDVRVAHGILRGERSANRAVFRNVPFAAVPFGPNRFLPPQPVEPWDGVRDATNQRMSDREQCSPACVRRGTPATNIR